MKLAISGKGGVGKSTISAVLSLLAARQGKRVLALDADPDANLASALGYTEEEQRSIVPISEQRALVEERTGAKVKAYGQIFKLNPEVADIADNYASTRDGVSLLVLGAVDTGGGGCACPENVLIRALVTDLILYKDDVLIMDMEAGVEHLGRATAKGVDCMVVVVEPGRRSIESAQRIIRMAGEIGLKRIKFVGNKVSSIADREYIEESLPEASFLGFIPFSDEFRRADRDGCAAISQLGSETLAVFEEMLSALQEEGK